MRGILSRVVRLEQAASNPAEDSALRERIEEAQARVEASLTPEERAYRKTSKYLAAEAAREARYEAKLAQIRAAGRKPTLADCLLAARDEA